MLDINKKISNLLRDIAPVELADSERELAMPSIYIQCISNSQAVSFDNKDFLTTFIYQIDIYAETPQRCMDIAQAVDSIMQREGWTRSNGIPQGRQRYTLTYKSQIDEKYNTYKE